MYTLTPYTLHTCRHLSQLKMRGRSVYSLIPHRILMICTTRTHAHTHMHTRAQVYTHTLSLTHSKHTHTQTQASARTHTHTHTHSFSLSLSRTHLCAPIAVGKSAGEESAHSSHIECSCFLPALGECACGIRGLGGKRWSGRVLDEND